MKSRPKDDPGDAKVIRQFDETIAKDIARFSAWVSESTGGLTIDAALIIELALTQGDQLVESYLAGHRKSRSPEQMKQKEETEAFLGTLSVRTIASYKLKLFFKKSSLAKLLEMTARVRQGLDNKDLKETWVFGELWREGGALAAKMWLRTQAEAIIKAFDNPNLPSEEAK
jgi:hypothetical protein